MRGRDAAAASGGGTFAARRALARGKVRGLYGMVDVTASPDRIHFDLGRALLRAGVSVIQIRWKRGTDSGIAELARRLAPLAVASGALLVVNDRLEVARAVPGAGLHIGDGDGDPAAVREALGPDRVLGLSTHDAASAAAAAGLGADYVGFGPVFSGETKGSDLAPRGIGGLAEAVGACALPVVAIGGITLADLDAVVAAGAAAAAAIRDVNAAADVEARARAWRAAFGAAA